jgi:hypothetical protein
MIRMAYYSFFLLLMAACTSSGHQAAADAHANPPPTAKTLSASEINATVIGRKHASVTSTGYPFSETLNPDGTATIKISTEAIQTGAWVMSDDVLCVTYQKYGKECNKVLSDGVSIWFVDSVSKKTNNKFSVQ